MADDTMEMSIALFRIRDAFSPLGHLSGILGPEIRPFPSHVRENATPGVRVSSSSVTVASPDHRSISLCSSGLKLLFLL